MGKKHALALIYLDILKQVPHYLTKMLLFKLNYKIIITYTTINDVP